MGRRLRVDMIACDGYGNCHELLPELIALDRWGYPVLHDREVPDALLPEARRAVELCPVLALRLTSPRSDEGTGAPPGPPRHRPS